MTKCAICKAPFVKRSMTHKAYSPECALKLAQMDRIKKQAKERRERRKAIKSRAQWLREAQSAFN